MTGMTANMNGHPRKPRRITFLARLSGMNLVLHESRIHREELTNEAVTNQSPYHVDLKSDGKQ